MRDYTLKSILTATALLLTTSLSAQTYITDSPTNGFDASNGSDYVIIYAPNELLARMGSKISSNQNLDATQTKNSFLYWVTDWDSSLLTMVNVEKDGVLNPYGGESFLNMTPVWEWGTGQFTAKSGYEYDLSQIDDTYTLHMDLRDGGNAESQYKFSIGDTSKSGQTFDLMVNLELGKTNDKLVGVGSMPHDKKWYCLDIPVKDLLDEEGNFGFSVDWSNKIETCFTVGFNKPTTSKETHKLYPGDAVQTYTITELNSALSLGSVFFYKAAAANPNGIENVQTAATDGETVVYDLSGRRTTATGAGILRG